MHLKLLEVLESALQEDALAIQAVHEMGLVMKKPFAVLGVAAACAACCAPLVLPTVSGTGLVGASGLAGGTLFGLPLNIVLCGGMALSLLSGISLWAWLRRQIRTVPACSRDNFWNTGALAAARPGFEKERGALRPSGEGAPE
ncbi:hypothetical protein OOT46_16190 [Aquabacterium sp. A7-Y]|uniref:hypothetical protein n=1 Tax=Aquabacterium sp. A7-Y TaxID=1349605 RepID=UPI00223DF206|nr:hypothetical protein [Aquabacterium sp. A7-Y]MCW7539385.1 hypothetical protein [Aquabacterium sp. A7-Y]